MTSIRKILLVEGENAGEESLRAALEKARLDVHVCHSGSDAVAWVREQTPDLIIFDSASMHSDGVHSCSQLRTLLVDTPIIHTRAKDVPKDTKAGADSYLVKPFTSRKVLNRVRMLLPTKQSEGEVVRAGEITLYRAKPSVDVGGNGEVRLTPKQANLIELFLRHPNQVLSRRRLMQEVWQTDYVGDTRTLDVHIRWVREAIEADPANPQCITTVRGVGYIFRLPPGGHT